MDSWRDKSNFILIEKSYQKKKKCTGFFLFHLVFNEWAHHLKWQSVDGSVRLASLLLCCLFLPGQEVRDPCKHFHLQPPMPSLEHIFSSCKLSKKSWVGKLKLKNCESLRWRVWGKKKKIWKAVYLLYSVHKVGRLRWTLNTNKCFEISAFRLSPGTRRKS